MKRMIAILSALILIVSVSVTRAEGTRDWFQYSEATATPAPNAFRFREGIRWGMNTQQVKALETEQMIERSMQNWSVMLTSGKVVVSRYTADLVFMFREDRLQMISYEFPQGTQESFLYLTGALNTVYGEKTETDPQKIKTMMDTINPDRYQTEKISQAYSWTYGDGTTIYLYYFSAADYAITYVSPEMGSRIYQTNGL